MAGPMAIRAKMRHAPTRRGSAAATRSVTAKRDLRVRRAGADRRPSHFVEPKSPAPSSNGHHTGGNSYAKALRYLASLNDFERLRIVRYNSQNFDLDRMRALLKKLGNPHDAFKSVHIAGTKG